MKPALVLVLFQNPVEVGFQFVFMHKPLPQIGENPERQPENSVAIASEVFASTVAISRGKQKSEILMSGIENFDGLALLILKPPTAGRC
jgi:hypothetical protein